MGLGAAGEREDEKARIERQMLWVFLEGKKDVLAGGSGPEGLPVSLQVLALPLLPRVSRLQPLFFFTCPSLLLHSCYAVCVCVTQFSAPLSVCVDFVSIPQ